MGVWTSVCVVFVLCVCVCVCMCVCVHRSVVYIEGDGDQSIRKEERKCEGGKGARSNKRLFFVCAVLSVCIRVLQRDI